MVRTHRSHSIKFSALVIGWVVTGISVISGIAVAQKSPPPNYFGSNPSASDIRAKLVSAGQRYHIPPHILFGIAYQESGWRQFGSDGRTINNPEPDGRVGVGIMQMTVFPSVSDYKRLCTDIDYNIDRGASLLIDKWNATPVIGDGVYTNGREKLENWFYAMWAYNGFSWVNNPNYNSSSYERKVLNLIASCPNGQWQNCNITAPANADIGTGYPNNIRYTPSPVHVDANFDGIIDSSVDGDIGRNSSERQHFLDCFYRNGGRSVIGNPINDAHWWGRSFPVVVQDFRGGSGGDGAIIDDEGTSHTTGFWLHGAIWNKYASFGGPDSPLHRPRSDETPAARSRQGTDGKFNRFDNGASIYWSSKWGAFATYGNIAKIYETAGGTGANNDYGFPVSDVIYWYDNWYYQWFEGPTYGDWRYIIVWGN